MEQRGEGPIPLGERLRAVSFDNDGVDCVPFISPEYCVKSYRTSGYRPPS